MRMSSRSSPSPRILWRCKQALEDAGIEMQSAELVYRPKSLVPIPHEGQVVKLMKLIDALEENDDVEAVHANFDVPAEMLEKVAG